MILYQKIGPEEVLNLIARIVGQTLPDDIKDSEAELNLSFSEDHSVEIYLIDPDTTEVPSQVNIVPAHKIAPVQKTPLIPDGQYDVVKVNELNFFDLSGKKAKTQGTSNKMYHAELQVAKKGGQAQIYSMYGPTRSVPRREWRHYPGGQAAAEKDYEKRIKKNTSPDAICMPIGGGSKAAIDYVQEQNEPKE